ncbi:MAG: M48 family metalloprotease [Acidobacteriaceae bacterium]|nr:M48 family metalloprotease [Acidobacteriaceae bacterium]
MKTFVKYIKLAAIFLAIPIICYLVLDSARSHMERGWFQALQKTIPSDRIPPLAGICQNPSTVASLELAVICTPYTNSEIFRMTAVLTAVGTVLFAALVWLAGIASKSNRHLLLRLFRPGFVVSNLVVAALLIIQAILITATIRCSQWNKTADDTIFYGVVFGLVALAGVFLTIKPLFGTARRANSLVIGQSLTATDNPSLWQFVSKLALQVGSDPPHHVVVGLTPAFFVTEADVQCIGGALSGRTMYLSLPLCRILTVDELSAVIAHELGHFRGEDTVFSLRFYPIYRGAIDSLNGVSEAAQKINRVLSYIPINAVRIIGLFGSLTLFPSVFMISFFLECFAGAENAVSRDRELAADALAAQTAGAKNIATALAKLHAFTGMWDRVTGAMKEGLLAGYVTVGDDRYEPRQFFSNVSELYALSVAQWAQPRSLDGLDSKSIPHPTDTHPPLSVRLSALGQTLAGITTSALAVSPDPSAQKVIDNCDAIEVQLSLVEQAIVSPQ